MTRGIKGKWAAVGLAGLLMASAPACAPVYVEGQYEAVYAEVSPPPPPNEVIPQPPGPGYAWVPGHWYWTGDQYVWSHGYWTRPPVTGHVWVPAGWILWEGRYRYVPGRWAHPQRRPTYRYVPAPPRPHVRPQPVKPPPVKQHMGVHPAKPQPGR